MRLKAIQPETLYATRDGRLIRTEDSPRAWPIEYAVDLEAGTFFVWNSDQPVDPWSPSTHKKMIRVETLEFDSKGQPVEGTEEACFMTVAEVGGTWADFVALHPRWVESLSTISEGRRAAARKIAETKQLLAARGLQSAEVAATITWIGERGEGLFEHVGDPIPNAIDYKVCITATLDGDEIGKFLS